jgi:hydrogenase maturation protease
MGEPVLVIGIGNDYRGDDAAGLAVVRALRVRQLEQVRLMECDGDCATLLEAWKDANKVILVDAASSGVRPGTTHRFDMHTQTLPAGYTLSSTHAFGITETLALARTLNQLPPCCIVYGIEGKHFATGDGLSPAVNHAIQRVVEHILADLQNIS